MLNQYELVIIFTPILSDEETKGVIGVYSDFVTENGGEMVHQETWGLKQLAYPIEKKTTGIYHLYEFKAPGDIVHKLEVQFKRDDRVMRHLLTRLDKYAIQYNESRRKKMKEGKAEKPEKVQEEA